MKVTSTCERQFIRDCIINKQKRVDGRQLLQGRTLEIVFGKERGCCMVLQGSTRVFVQVSCDISEPKVSTPTEGVVHVNLELSAMSTPDAKSQSRTSEDTVESQRAIERCIRDSKCIDLESLCIVSGSKVWVIRVDIHSLNNDGNLIECASIAAISALSHFRRPEVSVVGTDVTVYTVEEREPVALNLHHMPISISLALFDEGKTIIVDPNEIEERVCDGCYIIAINAHQEICFVHRHGVLLLKESSVQQCENIAVKRAQEVTQTIRTALDDDGYKRLSNMPIGFTNLIKSDTILGAKRPLAEINFDSIESLQDNTEPEVKYTPEEDDSVKESENDRIIGDASSYINSAAKNQTLHILHKSENDDRIIGDASSYINSAAKNRALHILQESEAAIFEGGPSKWGEDLDETENTSEEEIVDAKQDTSAVKEEINLDSEEETVYVNENQLDVKTPGSRGWYSRDPFM